MDRQLTNFAGSGSQTGVPVFAVYRSSLESFILSTCNDHTSDIRRPVYRSVRTKARRRSLFCLSWLSRGYDSTADMIAAISSFENGIVGLIFVMGRFNPEDGSESIHPLTTQNLQSIRNCSHLFRAAQFLLSQVERNLLISSMPRWEGDLMPCISQNRSKRRVSFRYVPTLVAASPRDSQSSRKALQASGIDSVALPLLPDASHSRTIDCALAHTRVPSASRMLTPSSVPCTWMGHLHVRCVRPLRLYWQLGECRRNIVSMGRLLLKEYSRCKLFFSLVLIHLTYLQRDVLLAYKDRSSGRGVRSCLLHLSLMFVEGAQFRTGRSWEIDTEQLAQNK